jgi:hypothetical protein
VAENSAIFSGDDENNGPGLTITGGVVTGGRPVRMQVMQGTGSSGTSSPVVYTGTAMSSTVVQYDARYLKALHGCGTPTLTLLRRVPGQ